CSGGSLDGGVCSTSNDCGGGTCNLVSLSGIAFADPMNGWAVGDANSATNMGTIVFTNDGGATWTVQSSNNTNPLYAVAAFNSATAWSVGGAGTRLDTTDGVTWQSQNPAPTNDLYGIAFPDATDGYAVGDFASIAQTTDGGNTWTTTPGILPTTADLFAVSSVDPFVAWVAGGNGTILRTGDGGLTWQSQTTNSTVLLFGIKFINGNSGWAVGEVDDNSGMGTILYTNDGSDNNALWTPQTSNSSQDLNAVAFVDQNNGWAVGNAGTIVNTTNGGTMWTAQNSRTTDDLYGIACVNSVNSTVCWAVGGTFDVASETQVILYTTDGGTTWSPQSSAYGDTLFAVAAVDTLTAWAVGDFGLILGTTDGGMTWTLQSSNMFNPLNAVAFLGSRNGWTAGDCGTILGTVSGGR
ncbi:MAG TPA: YCF48-related protein, partial [Candidatus Acidoferrales bacterium]|nr:YCF48-related protein [Candidatus Acidoferrales bacterium]